MATQDISLAAAQEKVIRQMLDKWQKQGKIKSDAEYDLLLGQYMKMIEAGTPIMNITAVSDVIDADRLTEFFEGFEIDVMSAYTAVNMIGETINKHKMLNQSVLNTVELDLKTMDDKLDEYEAMLGVNGAQGLYIQRFRDSNSFADWSNDFKDRDGNTLAPAYACSLDVELEAMQLPLVSWNNQLIGPSGVHLASIKIDTQIGSGFITLKNPEHGVEKAIDESMETFWSESILTDAPFQVDYTEPDSGLRVKNGAICELVISFDYMTQMTQISLTPFTEYPMRMEGILYYDEELRVWEPLIEPQQETGPEYFSSTISYEFPEITTRKLKIILNQIHYTKEDLIVSTKDERNKALWMKTTADTDVPSRYINKALYQNRAEEYPEWMSFLSRIKKQHTDLETFMKEFNADENYTLSKYKYDYGLYNISVYRNEYQDRGIYVSKPLPAVGVTKAVRISTKEYHPIVGAQAVTDIEYEVSDGRSWYPILPDNKSVIDCELLIPAGTVAGYTQCKLRFKNTSDVSVRKNGLKLTAGYTVNMGTVSIEGYDKSAVYTAEYTPDISAQTVDFLSKIPRVDGKLDLSQMQRSVEQFAGTDSNGYISLRYTPFVDRERLAALAADSTWDPTYVQSSYFPINVHVVDAGGQHIDQLLNSSDHRATYLTNVTDYYDPDHISKLATFEASALNYQYQVFGDKIQFNTALPKNARIVVEYPFLVSDLKVRAIMRRNSHLYQGITPMLNEYIVSFETLS